MQIYWILVLFFLRVRGDITLSTGSSSENSAHCEVTRDEDDEYCGAICYPIVKPLLRYAALCQGKDTMISELKDETSEKNVTIAELQGQLKLAKSTIKSLEEQLKHSANDILKMGKETKDEVAKIGMQIQDSNRVLVNKLMVDLKVQLKEEINVKGSRIVDLEAQIEELQRQLNTKSEDNKALTERIKVLETENNTSREEAISRTQEITVNQAKIRDQEAKIKHYQDQLTIKDGLVKSFESTLREKEFQFKSLTCDASNCLAFVNSTGIRTIRLPGLDPFDVPCNSSVFGSGWTVIQRRVNGKVDFNRTWTDYKQGFGDLREDFFMGLEKIHHITLDQPHELYIQLGMVNGSTGYAHFDDFKIGSEEEGYELKSLGQYSGTAGDSLTKEHLNMKFSTYDRDNDIAANYSCAKKYGGGWWFSNCTFSNLNGKYYKDGKRYGSDDFGIYWSSWHNYDWQISLQFTQMMIRPKTL